MTTDTILDREDKQGQQTARHELEPSAIMSGVWEPSGRPTTAVIMNTSLKLKFFEIVARVQHRKPMKKIFESRKADPTAMTVGP